MIHKRHNQNHSSLPNWQTIQIVIYFSSFYKLKGWWPITPYSLFLKKIKVFHIFEVFIAVVLIFHEGINFLSNFSLYFRILSHEINHHLSEIRRCICASTEEDTKLFQDFCLRSNSFFFLVFGIQLSSYKGLSDIVAFLRKLSLSNLLKNLYYLFSFLWTIFPTFYTI